MGIHIHLPLQMLSRGVADVGLLLYLLLIHFPIRVPSSKPPPILRPYTIHSYWISIASPLTLWTIFGIINDMAQTNTYEYGDQPYRACSPI